MNDEKEEHDDLERCHSLWQQEANGLKERLSQAEAELEHGEKEFIAMTQDRDRLTLRLSHLMDVAGKLSESLQAMTADAHELRAINRRNLGAKRDEKINATYYEDIKKAESLIAEWDGIKESL